MSLHLESMLYPFVRSKQFSVLHTMTFIHSHFPCKARSLDWGNRTCSRQPPQHDDPIGKRLAQQASPSACRCDAPAAVNGGGTGVKPVNLISKSVVKAFCKLTTVKPND